MYSIEGEHVSIRRQGDEVIVSAPGTSSAEDAKPLSEFGQKKTVEVASVSQSTKSKRYEFPTRDRRRAQWFRCGEKWRALPRRGAAVQPTRSRCARPKIQAGFHLLVKWSRIEISGKIVGTG